MADIEFTEEQIRDIWENTFGAKVPDSLTRKQIFEACLSELSLPVLREELKK